MYYEERLINNRLHFRNTPNGEWVEVSPESLYEKLVQSRAQVVSLHKTVKGMRESLLTCYNVAEDGLNVEA